MLLKVIEQDLKTHNYLGKKLPIFIEVNFHLYQKLIEEIVFTVKDSANPYNELLKVLLQVNVKEKLYVFGLEVRVERFAHGYKYGYEK